MSAITATLKKPRWIAAVVVGVLVGLACVQLGFWQLSRLDERRARNATIMARSAEPTRTLAGLRGQFGDDPEALAFRVAAVEGQYLASDEIVSVGRVYGDAVGTLVATPLDIGDGTTLIVVRGIVPAGTDGPPMVGYEVPDGRVVLAGRIALGEEPSRIAESPPPGGDLTELSRLDLDYIDEWVDGDVLPYTLLLDDQRPASPGAQPVPIPSEELSDGSHLGYAVQWFAFALIAFAGTVGLVLRASRSDETVPPPTDSAT